MYSQYILTINFFLIIKNIKKWKDSLLSFPLYSFLSFLFFFYIQSWAYLRDIFVKSISDIKLCIKYYLIYNLYYPFWFNSPLSTDTKCSANMPILRIITFAPILLPIPEYKPSRNLIKNLYFSVRIILALCFHSKDCSFGVD